MRYPASEKLEIIRLVEQSHLPTKQTLDRLGIPRRTFYRWYERYLNGAPEALEDRSSAPSRVWNRIPTGIHDQLIEMALEHSELSPRELAVRFTDEKGYFISEASVYRLLKAHDLITSPAYVVIKAANEFHTKTSRPNQMWQTDFTCFKIIGWGWMYLSTVLDDLVMDAGRDTVPDPVGRRGSILQCLGTAIEVTIIPAIEGPARDAQPIQRLPGGQVRLFDQSDDL